jgi:hypothetical protein
MVRASSKLMRLHCGCNFASSAANRVQLGKNLKEGNRRKKKGRKDGRKERRRQLCMNNLGPQ